MRLALDIIDPNKSVSVKAVESPSKLQSFVKNELQSHDELPAWLQGALLVEETNKLNIKKV